MLATVPSCGATTGISIFIASTITMLSPAFTACPTDASIFTTLPGTESVTFTEPAPAEAEELDEESQEDSSADDMLEREDEEKEA